MNYRSPAARLLPRLLWLLAAAPIACAPAGSESSGNGSGGKGNVATGGTTSSTGGASPNEGSGGAVDPGTTGGVTGSTGGASETGGSVGSGGAGAGGASGGTGGAGGGGVPPAGMVPMFVATGYGARTITSCDDGKTWIADHVYNPTTGECNGPTPCNRSHQDLTEKGLVYGNGMFVQIVGWGANPSVNVSRNGIDWKLTKIPASLIRIDGNIVFLTEPTPHFVALMGYRGFCAESTDAETWKACPAAPMYQDSLREAGGGGPAIGGGGDNPMVFSFDSAKTWETNPSCAFGSEFGNLGQEGGIMWGHDALVVVNTGGSWCHTKDLGKTWQTGKFSDGGAVGKASFSGGKFWAPNGAYAHTSDDGVTWTRIDFKPSTVRIHEMAVGDSGTLVGVERLGDTGNVSKEPTRFYRSVDGGQNWTMSTAAAGTMFRRVVFGYGLPSAKCPMPQ
ncbi:MAG: hypothetical protein ABJA82_12480 [Myxococcales bacterium]